MAKKARKYSVDFKREAVRQMAEATTIVGLAEKLGVRRKLLYQWRDQLKAAGIAGLERRKGQPPGSKSQNGPLSGTRTAPFRGRTEFPLTSVAYRLELTQDLALISGCLPAASLALGEIPSVPEMALEGRRLV